MNYSTNYSMREPVPAEKVKVADINYNTEIIDGVMLDNRQISIDMYDDTSTYNTDDLAGHENSSGRIAVYRCLQNNTTGAWDSTKWVQTNLADEITDIRGNAGASDLGDLNDVDLTNPTEGQVLTYDEQNDEWVNSDLPDADVTKTASGNPIEFTDGADAPLVKCVTQITGSQDLHGYDKPWVGGAGKNKYSVTAGEDLWNNNVSATHSNDNGILVINCTNGTYSGVFGNGVQTQLVNNVPVSKTVSFDIKGSVAATIKVQNNSIEITTEYQRKYITISANTGASVSIYGNGTANTIYVKNMAITEDGSTSWEPYSNICPITAYTEGEIEVRGKNIWDEQWEVGSLDASGEPVANSNSIRSKNYTPCQGNVDYYLNYSLPGDEIRICFYDENKTFVSRTGWLYKGTFQTPTTARYMKLLTSTVYGSTYRNDIIIAIGSQAVDYEPYTSTTHTTTYPSAIYRGSEDCVGESVKIGRVKKTFVGSAGELWNYNSQINQFYIQLADIKDTLNALCNLFPTLESSFSESYIRPENDTILQVRLQDDFMEQYNITDIASWKGFLSTCNLEVVCNVTETTSSVTPTNLPIRTLSSYNHIESSTGDMEIEYFPAKEQPLIDLIPEASNMHTYSTAEHAVGTWIDGETIYEQTYTYSGTVAANPFQTTIDMTGKNLIEVIQHYARFTYDSGESYGECVGAELIYSNCNTLNVRYVDSAPYTLTVSSFLGNATESYDIAFTLRYTKQSTRSLAKSAPQEETKEEQVEELKEEPTEETKEEPTKEVKEEPEEVKEEPTEEVKEEETKEEGEVNER